MALTNNVITSQGANLLAQATTSNKIILDDVRLSTTYLSYSQLLNISESTTYNLTGSIEQAYTSGRYARITGRVNQADVSSSKQIKSVWVMAHLQNNATSTSLCAFGVNSSSKYIYIPPSSTGTNAVFRFPFSIYFQNDSSVLEVVDAQYAGEGELDRFVSMYSAVDQSQGEAQSILGLKSFGSGLYIKKPLYQTTGTTINISTGQQTVIIGLAATVGDVLTVPTSLVRPCTLTGTADSSHYIMGGKYLALSYSPNTTTPLLVVKIPDEIS